MSSRRRSGNVAMHGSGAPATRRHSTFVTAAAPMMPCPHHHHHHHHQQQQQHQQHHLDVHRRHSTFAAPSQPSLQQLQHLQQIYQLYQQPQQLAPQQQWQPAPPLPSQPPVVTRAGPIPPRMLVRQSIALLPSITYLHSISTYYTLLQPRARADGRRFSEVPNPLPATNLAPAAVSPLAMRRQHQHFGSIDLSSGSPSSSSAIPFHSSQLSPIPATPLVGSSFEMPSSSPDSWRWRRASSLNLSEASSSDSFGLSPSMGGLVLSSSLPSVPRFPAATGLNNALRPPHNTPKSVRRQNTLQVREEHEACRMRALLLSLVLSEAHPSLFRPSSFVTQISRRMF